MKQSDDDLKGLSRREALQKLASLSAYTAPTVVALLTPSISHSQGSALPPETPECGYGGAHYSGVLGANSNASSVGGDATNENPPGYWSPNNGRGRGGEWIPPGDGWGGSSDHGEYNSFAPDTAADCGE